MPVIEAKGLVKRYGTREALRGVIRHLAAGKRTVLELHVSKRVRRTLAKRGLITINVRGRDAAGNLRTASVTVHVKRG